MKFFIPPGLLLICLIRSPPILAQTNQTLPNGSSTTPVTFPISCYYTWTNDKPGIGLPATGNGNIASFTAINTTPNPITATITATPVARTYNYAYLSDQPAGTISVLDLASNTIINTISTPVPGAITFTPGPGGILLYATTPTSVIVINTVTNTIVNQFPTGMSPEVLQLAVSPDGSKLYLSDTQSGIINVVDAGTGQLINTLSVPPDLLDNFTISRDGTRLYVAEDQYNTVLVLDIATNTVIASIPVSVNPTPLQISPDGTLLYVIDQSEANISVINTSTNTVIATIPTPGSFTGPMTISPDGSTLYAAVATFVGFTQVASIAVISTATNTITTSIPMSNFVNGLSETPDGTRLVAEIAGSNLAAVIDPATNSIITTVSAACISRGNFIAPYNCTGSPITFTITVTPTFPTITASAETGSISACAGTASASPAIEQATISAVYLTTDITATAPAGFEVSLLPGSGYGSTVVIPQTAGTVTPTTLYIRSSTTAPAGNPSGNIVLTSTGAIDQDIAVSAIVNPLTIPSVTINASATNICAGTPVTFSALPVNPGTTPSYQWLVNGNPAGTNSTDFTTNTLANNDQVSCTLTSNAGCAVPVTTASASIPMVVIPATIPTIDVTASDNNICEGTPVTFTAAVTNEGNTPSYQWTLNTDPVGSNAKTFSLDNAKDGDLIACTITSSLTCGSTATSSVTMTVNPLPSISFSPDTLFTSNGTGLRLNPTITGTIATWQWSPATGLSSTNQADPIADPAASTTYRLLVTTDKDCKASALVTVSPHTYLAMANGFTPNGDGHNDVFRIPPGVQFVLQQFDVFDKWGNIVFSTQDIDAGWDGTYHGNPSPQGAYVYIIRGKTPAGTPVLLKGTVILVR